MKRAIAIFLLWCFPSTLSAEGLKLFPMWERKQCPTETFACYTFDQAKSILKLDLELQFRLEECEVCKLAVQDLTVANKKLNEAAELLEANNKILDARLIEKQEAIEVLAATVAKLDERDVLGKALPWVIAAGAVVAAGAFVGGYYLGTSR